MSVCEKAQKLADRYIADNPKEPLCFRAFYRGGILRGDDYRYHADFNRLFKASRMGDTAHLRCIYKSDCDGEIGLSLTLFGSAQMYVNKEMVFKSTIFDERNNHQSIRINIPVKTGDNLIELVFKKTPLGFGGIFGTWLPKWDYIFFDPDHPLCEGCRYRLNDGEWLPKAELEQIRLMPEEYALFYAKDADGNDVFLKSTSPSFPPEEGYVNPFGIEGFGPWVGLYPLKSTTEADFLHPSEGVYWKFKYKNVYLRPYNPKGNFGKWNYPLGLTLYGLLRYAEESASAHIKDYVLAHARRTLETLDYAFWDKEHNGGAATLHNLLCSIDSLDDCGAFGAFIQEAALKLGLENCRGVCDFIADYMQNRQDRLENGAFYRKNQLHSFHNETMWLDDLYMSVPFLCRRYIITGDESCLEDCVNQFLRYKELLYMEDEKLLSHVFDFRHGLRNNIPWGRGNGWTVFSLTELLRVLPENHPSRGSLEEFFKELCQGLKARQSADGRWHQVLNENDSYLETSCTAMFVCAFIRGVGMKLLPDEYIACAKRGVESLCENCIDERGNLYGVCRGSEFAFSSDYYKNELKDVVNDNHGTGIVLLALCELMAHERATKTTNGKDGFSNEA